MFKNFSHNVGEKKKASDTKRTQNIMVETTDQDLYLYEKQSDQVSQRKSRQIFC